MTTTLITGGNKGLGRETARQLKQAGHDVWIGARDEARGAQAAEELSVRFVQLDVTDDASVQAAAQTVGALDVLVNNAGIVGSSPAIADTGAEDMRAAYETNVFGPVRVLRAFLPLLQASDAPVVVNVSSGLGSIGLATDFDHPYSQIPLLAYPSSKSALNMLTLRYAAAFRDMRINAVDPGYTATDLNGHSGPQSIEEGAEIIVRMAQIGADGPTATFVDKDGPQVW